MGVQILLDPKDFMKTWRPLRYVRSYTLVNNTTATVNVQVPKNKLWIIQTIHAKNGDDVARYMSISLADDQQNALFPFWAASITAATNLYLPNLDDQAFKMTSGIDLPYIVRSHENIRFYWLTGGVSAGGASPYGIFGIEVDLP